MEIEWWGPLRKQFKGQILAVSEVVLRWQDRDSGANQRLTSGGSSGAELATKVAVRWHVIKNDLSNKPRL